MAFNQMEAAVEQCSVDKKYFDIQKKELFLDNDRLLEHIICQDVMNIIMHADVVSATMFPVNNKYFVHANVKIDFIAEYNETLKLKAQVAKKEHMVEKNVFNELVLRCSRLENRSKLKVKDLSIANLKKHIESLKGINMAEKDVPPNNANVIALGMFKLDLEPLSPKLSKNRDAHIDCIKHTQEHANTLREIVKHARALITFDSDLDSACKYATRILEVLVYVSATCHCLTKASEKLVAFTPLDKNKKVRNEEFYYRTVTIDGNRFRLTRITSNNVVPPKNPLSTKVTKKTAPGRNNPEMLKDVTSISSSSRSEGDLNRPLVPGLQLLQAYDWKPL
ncbi:hypothetical protein Tco_1135049 [Tanacetum coccineum]